MYFTLLPKVWWYRYLPLQADRNQKAGPTSFLYVNPPKIRGSDPPTTGKIKISCNQECLTLLPLGEKGKELIYCSLFSLLSLNLLQVFALCR